MAVTAGDTRVVVVSFALALLVSPPASAQLAAPNANGVAIGHVHVNAVDLEAQTRFWTLLGGTIVQRDKLTLVQYPGIYVILRVQAPSGGTVGSRLNHFGFLVKDFAGSVAKWKAAGLNWEPVINPQVGQGFLMGPDDVRVEIYEDTSIASPFTMHHIHLLVPDPPAAQRCTSNTLVQPLARGWAALVWCVRSLLPSTFPEPRSL